MESSARVRGQLYGALAVSYQKPEAGEHEGDGDSLLHDLLRASFSLDAPTVWSSAKRLSRALEITHGRDREMLLELQLEYHRLFVGPGRPQVLPFESSYRDRWRMTMGPSALDVQRRYAEAGLGLARGHQGPPDHVATELGFMGYLVEKGADASDAEQRAWLRRERAFLRDHIAVWLPAFCQRVKEVSQHPFYTALADLTEAFISWDMGRSEVDHEPQLEGAMR